MILYGWALSSLAYPDPLPIAAREKGLVDWHWAVYSCLVSKWLTVVQLVSLNIFRHVNWGGGELGHFNQRIYNNYKGRVLKQDCYNKINKLRWNTSLMMKNPRTFSLERFKVKIQSYLIYNTQGVVDPSKDQCLLAIQTKFQLQTYQQYLHTVVCIEFTFKITKIYIWF